MRVVERQRGRSTVLQRLAAFGGLVSICMTTTVHAVPDSDKVSFPPATREFHSDSQRFHFVLTTGEGGRALHADAELFSTDEDHRHHNFWRRLLPNERGPRTTLVSDQGDVVVVDEWINVASRHAITLIALDGRVVADFSLDQLIELLGVSRQAISGHAKEGVWMSRFPVIDNRTQKITFSAGGRTLTLQLSDGRLTAAG